jgi:hypothetical protein
MRKGFAVSIAIVLLLISGAFAAVEQEQQFDIISTNLGSISGAGVSAVTSINFVPLVNEQATINETGNIQYVQTGIGSLFQGASAAGFLGEYGYEQAGIAAGSQMQGSPSYLILGFQDQNIGTAFDQDIFTVGGLGSATAIQNFTGNQNQFIATPYGVSANIQVLGVGELDGVNSHVVSLVNRAINIEHVSRLRY